MSEKPTSQNQNPLPRTAVIGIFVAVVPIVLFIIVYSLLENSGVEDVPRILISLCLPPAILAILFGIYLVAIPKKPSG